MHTEKPRAQGNCCITGAPIDNQRTCCEAAITILNLATFVRRLCYQVKKTDYNNKVVTDAMDYLLRHDLTGTFIRKDDDR